MTPDLPRAGTVTLFTTHWCPYCLRLKATLRREGVPFDEVDIGSSEDGAVSVSYTHLDVYKRQPLILRWRQNEAVFDDKDVRR